MKERTISQLRLGETAIVVALQGGYGFQRRLRGIGLKEGKTVRLRAKHPLGGPLVVEVDGRQITLGRGMAGRITVSPEA